MEREKGKEGKEGRRNRERSMMGPQRLSLFFVSVQTHPLTPPVAYYPCEMENELERIRNSDVIWKRNNNNLLFSYKRFTYGWLVN